MIEPQPNKKGDKSIIAELEYIRFRNRSDDNPNLKRPRMIFDFAQQRVCVDCSKQTERA